MGVETGRIMPANGSAAEEKTVGPLLARAKLMRQRGQWDESIAICTDALRQCPDSVTAYSLLGEVYESMGKLDVASQWYAMAVEREPGNSAEKAKLERTLMAQQAQRPIVLKAQSPRASAPAKERTLERTLQWFDRAFPPGKADSIARLIFAVSGILAALLLLSAAIVFLVFRQNGGQTSAAFGGSELLPTVGEPLEPIIVMPRAASAEIPASSGAFLTSATAQSKPPLLPSAPKPAPTMPPVSPAERVSALSAPGANGAAPRPNDPDAELRASIARATGAEQASTIRHDVRGQAVGVEVFLPREVGEMDMKTKWRVLLAAAQTAQAVTRYDANTQIASVRVILCSPPAIPGGEKFTEIAFSGECTLTEVRNADTSRMTMDDLINKFYSSSWGPALGGLPTAY